ncbi:2-hydroxyisoflavanone dehydratase [Thalictrum thalictroides]|uniref:2-hydroxyisoflavanone dehydratase n=1 Tax=Thalictrum thalictroides TaxID=46969 RepID=A0A7J6WGA4_THATH|nr:2-hydroxyisoflavanone dehydratase [Thalictrum thalictroides]
MFCEKKIVDQVLPWLRVFEDGTVDRSWTGPPELEFMVKSVPSHEDFIDGVATRDVNIKSESGLSVRIYLPELNNTTTDDDDGMSKLPVILHFHGGGFCISQADWYMYYAAYTRLARTAKAIIVSVYLRRAPENQLPAACDDGFNALLWLQSLARKESTEPWLQAHADFGRIFLIGDSSGGNIVHDVAARSGKEVLDPLRLVGCIPIHPGFIRSKRSKSESELQHESPFLTLEMVDKFLGLALPTGSNKDHPITCPMGPHAPLLNGLNLPPFLVILAQNDLIRDTEIEYCEAMKEAGKDVEVFWNESVGHSFYLNKVAVDMDPHIGAQTDILFSAITDFIKRH